MRSSDQPLLLATIRVFPSALKDVVDQALGIRAMLTVLPLATVSDAVDFVVDSDGTALGDAQVSASLNTLSQHASGLLAIIGADAVVQLVEVDTMLESAVLNEVLIWDFGVVAGHAHGEAEVDLGIRVDVGGAELDDVTKAFGLAMHAGDSVIVVGGAVRSLLAFGCVKSKQ